jgi:ribosomal protein S3
MSVAPVTALDAPVAKNNIAEAISSGLAMRRIGVKSIQIGMRSGS